MTGTATNENSLTGVENSPVSQAAAAPGTLGWGRFILQFVTVTIVFFAASVPAVLMLGMTSEGLIGSVAGSMAAALLLCWFWLGRDGHLAAAWNLRAPKSWGYTFALASLATVLIIAWFQAGSWLVSQLGIDTPNVVAVMDFVTESPTSFVMWIVFVAWFAAGFGEELLYRGFLMDRLQRLRGIGDKIWLVILIQAVLFSFPHLYQGLGGVLITGVVGAGLGYLRVKCGGNLWACILAHAAVDTIMMSLAYANSLGMLGTS